MAKGGRRRKASEKERRLRSSQGIHKCERGLCVVKEREVSVADVSKKREERD
jgi:hypothetical protein